MAGRGAKERELVGDRGGRPKSTPRQPWRGAEQKRELVRERYGSPNSTPHGHVRPGQAMRPPSLGLAVLPNLARLHHTVCLQPAGGVVRLRKVKLCQRGDGVLVYLSSLSFLGYAAGDRACPGADCPTDNTITYATAKVRLCQAFSSWSATNTRRSGRSRVALHWGEPLAFPVSQEPRPKAQGRRAVQPRAHRKADLIRRRNQAARWLTVAAIGFAGLLRTARPRSRPSRGP